MPGTWVMTRSRQSSCNQEHTSFPAYGGGYNQDVTYKRERTSYMLKYYPPLFTPTPLSRTTVYLVSFSAVRILEMAAMLFILSNLVPFFVLYSPTPLFAVLFLVPKFPGRTPYGMAFHPQHAHAPTPQKSLLPLYHPLIWQTSFHPSPSAAPYHFSMTHTFGAELINNVIASLTLKYRWMDGWL
jgi:hypothetical protein